MTDRTEAEWADCVRLWRVLSCLCTQCKVYTDGGDIVLDPDPGAL